METETTQRMCAPSALRLPTVFTTSRKMAESSMRSAAPCPWDAGVFLLEPFDFRREHALKFVVNLAGIFESVAVNQKRSAACGAPAGSRDRNGEKVIHSRHSLRWFGFVLRGHLIAREIFIDVLGNRRVVANDNEDRRRILEQELIGLARGGGVTAVNVFLLVVFVKLLERGLQYFRQAGRLFDQFFAFSFGRGLWRFFAAGFGQLVADVLRTNFAIPASQFAGVFVARREKRNFHQPGFKRLQ